ncbi:MAG: hypothetical protein JSV42_10910 [Chloroflexota bacterium]|nr:MAG: hypothetical protein JSV42_10910 [Chloroflexota bacterium]
MTANISLDPKNLISPSELVLLNGEQFAKKVLLGNIQLLHTDVSVSIAQLAQAMLTAAVLADEAAGNIHLDVRQGKAMFGLRKVNNLYANPTPQPNQWPQYSLESKLPEIATQLMNDEDSHQVSNLIYAWLRQDSAQPWQSAIEMVKQGMAERGLLDRTEEKRLKVLTVVNYSLPSTTAEMTRQLPVQPVKQLLDTCASSRQDIWGLLEKELKKAIKDRTEQDNDVDFD